MEKKKIIPLAITIFASFFAFFNITEAAIYSATAGMTGSYGAVSCSEDENGNAFCYNTNFYGGNSHIGLRFSLVKYNGGNSGYGSIDYLTGNLISQLQAIPDTTPVLTLSNKPSKQDISQHGSSWYTSDTVGPDIVSTTGNTLASQAGANSADIMLPFNDIVVEKDGNPGREIYERIFGESDRLVHNYNTGYNDGHYVFGNGSTRSDYQILNDIIIALLGGGEYADPAAALETLGLYIQIEPITIINMRVGSSSQRYLLYGTTSEIRAMMGQISNNTFYHTGSSVYVSSLLESGAQQALTGLNNGFYATVNFGGPYESDGVCDGRDWILPGNHNCGIGILAGLGGERKVCQIEDDDTTGKAYYGMYGDKLNDTYSNASQEFINQCVCDIGTKEFKEGGETLVNTTYSFFTNASSEYNEIDYIEEWCYHDDEEEEDPASKTCTPTITDQNCGDAGNKTFSIGDNEECVFNSINQVVNDADTNGSRYTRDYNQYCSLTCVEKIDFELPGLVGAIDAGKYWTWDRSQIKLTGTRTCQSTVDVAGYQNDLYEDGSIGEIFKDGEAVEDAGIDEYGLLEELNDLKEAYDEYGQLEELNDEYGQLEELDDYSVDEVDYSEKNCDMWGNNCDYSSCYEEIYTSEVTDQTFYRYYIDGDYYDSDICDGYGDVDDPWTDTDNDLTLDESMDNLENLYNDIVEELADRTNDVNSCTAGLGSIRNQEYEFNPIVNLQYADSRYGSPLYSYTGTVTSDIKPPEDPGFATSNYSYCQNISDDSCTDEADYYNGTNNSLVWQKTIEYDSNEYFYAKNVNHSKGVLNRTTKSDFEAKTNVYKYGNNFYPISLNATAGEYEYVLSFKNLGVNQLYGTTSNRFDKLVVDTNGSLNMSNALDYVCYYNVNEDVLKDQKPDFFYRNVSLNNFDPNNRDENSDMMNWDSTNVKAAATLAEIEDNKDNVYNEEPEYSFTLTPDNMQEIRKYNHEREDSGGYSDFNMTGVSVESVDYANTLKHDADNTVWYLSDFITNGESNGYFTMNRSDRTFTAFEDWEDLVEQNMGPAWK